MQHKITQNITKFGGNGSAIGIEAEWSIELAPKYSIKEQKNIIHTK